MIVSLVSPSSLLSQILAPSFIIFISLTVNPTKQVYAISLFPPPACSPSLSLFFSLSLSVSGEPVTAHISQKTGHPLEEASHFHNRGAGGICCIVKTYKEKGVDEMIR